MSNWLDFLQWMIIHPIVSSIRTNMNVCICLTIETNNDCNERNGELAKFKILDERGILGNDVTDMIHKSRNDSLSFFFFFLQKKKKKILWTLNSHLRKGSFFLATYFIRSQDIIDVNHVNALHNYRSFFWGGEESLIITLSGLTSRLYQ